MSRAAVRQYVQAWFDPATGSNWATTANPAAPPVQLDKVWTSFPKRIDFRQWARTQGSRTRAQAVVFIRGQKESRTAIGGAHSGKKRVSYDVVLQVFVESYLPNSEQVMADVDALADALSDRLRADHNLGQDPTVIFAAGEPDIAESWGEPFTNAGGATEQWFQLAFTVVVYLTA